LGGRWLEFNSKKMNDFKEVLSKYPNIIIENGNSICNYCVIESMVHGLFACFYCILYGLYICELENLIPIVLLDEKHLYYDSKHGNNIFNYFFKQERVNTVGLNKIIVQNPDIFLHWCRNSTLEKKISSLLIDKYFELKPDIKSLINTFYKHNIRGQHILGVHYRGTDKISETHLLPFIEYEKKIDIMLKNNICDKVFFVTDELHLRKYVESKYKNHVIFYALEADYKTIRPDQKIGLHFSNLPSPYLLAKDALAECYLLSKCNLFMSSGRSSMSLFATFINPQIIHVIIEP